MLLSWVLLGLLIFSHSCGICWFIIYFHENLIDEKIINPPVELIQIPNNVDYAIIAAKALFWELIVLAYLLILILSSIANRKYTALYSHRFEECASNYQPMADGSGVTCDSCGYFISDSLIDNQNLDELNELYRHNKDTAEWKKFKGSLWYQLIDD